MKVGGFGYVAGMVSMTPDVSDDHAFGVLWGKSNANNSVNLLLQHLLDTAAVAELMWDRFLAPVVRNAIDACCGGQGRSLFALVCGLHDVGKASPAFQAKVPELAEAVRAAGLSWRPLDGHARNWHHTLAGAHILSRVLRDLGWPAGAISWVVPLVSGHHGVIPAAGAHRMPAQRGNAQGGSRWEAVQDALVFRVASELGIELAEVAPFLVPRRGVQLAVSGAVIMADWIASADRQFGGVADLARVSMAGARERAIRGWDQLQLRGGWDPAALRPEQDLVLARFGRSARPAQLDAIGLASEIPTPGLVVLEAPMGEGKTEAALAAVEVLAGRFGADGVFVGMPTQATSDPMFSRVRQWAGALEPGIPVGLLHGKRQFNREWRQLQQQVGFHGIDEFGCDDRFGLSDQGTAGAGSQLVPAEWFLGRKRGLLSALTVGTVDQLLYAATRTRHVMVRHAGLAGRVVVLDEVHAYDVYMAQFLFEALRWLGDTGVPVVLLSATLPPTLRAELVRAYLQGALTERDVDLGGLPVSAGYPSALSACVVNRRPHFAQLTSRPWRPSVPVAVEVLAEEPTEALGVVVAALSDALRDGGCALVVRNTVRRAQETYAAVRAEFGADAVLLHARLTVGERADRTERILELLGPPGRAEGASRPGRLVVVATQLAEQSFDVDVDLLVTDVAPIDLLLQRVGRLHRHDRPAVDRPAPVRTPRVLVTGMAPDAAGGPPRFPRGSERVYGEYLLLRAAACVLDVRGGPGWSVPADVPDLVARGYGVDCSELPELWQDRAAAAQAEAAAQRAGREAAARQFVLAGEDELGRPTLAGLHERSVSETEDDDVAAAVRDGDESIEVVLVRRTPGGYLTLTGRALGPQGAAAVSDNDVLDEVARCAVRLPAHPQITEAAKTTLRPLAGWSGDPWLARARALELDDEHTTELGGYRLTYCPERGLLDEHLTARAR